MKLLTTIAAVLISISAFSQDYVEYDNGTFSQNGEELSLEQIKHLTLRYQTGIGDFRKGNYFNRMHMDGDRGIGYTAANFIGGAAAGLQEVLGSYMVALSL